MATRTLLPLHAIAEEIQRDGWLAYLRAHRNEDTEWYDAKIAEAEGLTPLELRVLGRAHVREHMKALALVNGAALDPDDIGFEPLEGDEDGVSYSIDPFDPAK